MGPNAGWLAASPSTASRATGVPAEDQARSDSCNSHNPITLRRYLTVPSTHQLTGGVDQSKIDSPGIDAHTVHTVPRGAPHLAQPVQYTLVDVEDVPRQRFAHVAFVGGPFSIPQVADRHEGFSAALDGDGGAEIRVVTTPNLTVAAGRRAGEEIADLDPAHRPTAVFCANDLLALGVLQEMTLRGVRVPRDVAIVGYDDIDFAAAAAVPLSSVRQPREQLGRTAAQLLLEEVNDGELHQHRHVVFKPDLVVRESSSRRRRPTTSATPHRRPT